MSKIKSVECFTVQELKEELERRELEGKKTKDDSVLVFGSIGNDAGINFIEVFKKINSPNDLNFLDNYSFRVRFNSQRKISGFYFRTSEEDFVLLSEELSYNNEEFANFILDSKNIKYCKI
jgi:hypothetical protein